MHVVRTHCHGYANGCECPMCLARREGIHHGPLFYDGEGSIRHKRRPNLVDDQAVAAYRFQDRHKVPKDAVSGFRRPAA